MTKYRYLNRTGNTITTEHYTIPAYDQVITDGSVAELDNLDGNFLEKLYLSGNQISVQVDYNSNIPLVSATKGNGLKIDPTNPQFGWHDLRSPTTIYEGASSNKPVFAPLVDGIRKYQFKVGDESFHEFHLPHDYAPNTDMYIHVHWTQATSPTVPGTLVWQFSSTYAKGYSQGTFASVKTATVTATTTTSLVHNISEIKFTTANGSSSMLDTALLETDGLILTRVSLLSNTSDVDPFMMFCDIHYQSTNIPTKNRNYDFWN